MRSFVFLETSPPPHQQWQHAGAADRLAISNEVPVVKIRDDLNKLLKEREMFDENSEGWSSQTIIKKLEGFNLKRTSKKSQGYVHFIGSTSS